MEGSILEKLWVLLFFGGGVGLFFQPRVTTNRMCACLGQIRGGMLRCTGMGRRDGGGKKQVEGEKKNLRAKREEREGQTAKRDIAKK